MKAPDIWPFKTTYIPPGIMPTRKTYVPSGSGLVYVEKEDMVTLLYLGFVVYEPSVFAWPPLVDLNDI
jgi:hypothetical protein